MAKSGSHSKVHSDPTPRSADTKELLVRSAIATLTTEGFSGTSARAIAERSGISQGLIFYHFGSVINLLLAALDAVSDERMSRFSAAVAGASTPAQLADVATMIFRDDLDSGHVTVLVEMLAGASSTPGLGAEVSARLQPWFAFTKATLDTSLSDSPLGALIPTVDAAYAIVALYLGLEMLTHLDGNREPALRTFSHLQQLVTLVSSFGALLAPRVAT